MRCDLYLIGYLAVAPMAVFAHENQLEWSNDGTQTCISSNGVPNHDIGKFPNRANPNAFQAQTLHFCFPSSPTYSGEITDGLMTVGVTLSGLPMRPFTAGYYDPDGRNGIGHDPDSEWRQQAMFAPRRLGMDTQNGHVDVSGLYHYHAVSPRFLASLDTGHIGYAPDGFEIHYDGEVVRSSWQLKSGSRITAPYGEHSGLFEEDFEYVAGAGDLDECNGRFEGDVYRYYATDDYPFFPRCFKGVVAGQFFTRNP